MSASDDVTFTKLDPEGAGSYAVHHRGALVGTVGHFRMGAGQFGSSWMATTPAGLRSTRFPSRHAAAAWLVEQATAWPA